MHRRHYDIASDQACPTWIDGDRVESFFAGRQEKHHDEKKSCEAEVQGHIEISIVSLAEVMRDFRGRRPKTSKPGAQKRTPAAKISHDIGEAHNGYLDV